MSIEAYCAHNRKDKAARAVEPSEDELAATIRTGIREHQRKSWPEFRAPGEAIEVVEHELPGEEP